jgi:hypothetical protein
MVVVLMLGALMAGCAEETSSNVVQNSIEEGKLSITVTDKTTKKPVSDAQIFIVGVESSYKTDEQGKSPDIALKVNKDIFKRYGAELAKKAPAGCATIIVVKEGYKDQVVFNKAIYPGYSANRLNIQLSTPAKDDTDKFAVDYQYPHEQWIQELLQYCSTIKDGEAGNGENKLTITIKDQKSKAVQDAVVIIPEYNIKATTDKSGKVELNPPAAVDTLNAYPVQRDISEYTVIVSKEGYASSVVFNVTAGGEKDSSLDITLKLAKDKTAREYSATYNPYEKEWVEKIIDNYKAVKE